MPRPSLLTNGQAHAYINTLPHAQKSEFLDLSHSGQPASGYVMSSPLLNTQVAQLVICDGDEGFFRSSAYLAYKRREVHFTQYQTTIQTKDSNRSRTRVPFVNFNRLIHFPSSEAEFNLPSSFCCLPHVAKLFLINPRSNLFPFWDLISSPTPGRSSRGVRFHSFIAHELVMMSLSGMFVAIKQRWGRR